MKKSNGLHTKNTSVNSIKKQCSISVRNKNNIKQNNPLNTILNYGYSKKKRNISINPDYVNKVIISNKKKGRKSLEFSIHEIKSLSTIKKNNISIEKKKNINKKIVKSQRFNENEINDKNYNLTNNIFNEENFDNNNNKILEEIIKKEKRNNEKIIKEILEVINKEYENKIKEINIEIKKDKLNDKSNDINQMNTINETLNTKCDILNEELDIKEKELSHLIGKYTRLAEKKEKILNNLIIKKREQNSITMRSQRNQNDICGITVEANEKGCGCEIGDFCFIF